MYEIQSSQSDVLQKSNETPIVVQFYADWCGPCQVMKPVMKNLVKKANGKWDLRYLNVQKEPGFALQYEIKSIPTLIIFSKEMPVAKLVGSKPSYIIQNWLDNNLPSEQLADEYQQISDAVRKGNIDQAKDSILEQLAKVYKDNPMIKILQSLEKLGRNNNSAKNDLEMIERKGPFGKLVKNVRDIIEQDEDEKSIHTPTASPFNKRATDVFAKINIQAIDFDLLSELILAGINEIRNKKGATDLLPDPVLTAAARDQNDYQIRFDQLSHYQSNPEKRTVKDRIEAFGGGFRVMGENVQYKGFPVQIIGARREIIAGTYQDTANELVRNWVNSPGHYRNLINADFRFVGTSVGWNPENSALFATQVFGKR